MDWNLQQYYTDLIEFRAKYSYKCDLVEYAISDSNRSKAFILKKLSQKMDVEFEKLVRKHYFQSLRRKLSSIVSIPFLSIVESGVFDFIV
ncbi:hypothetical protein [Pedobacter agri]|uniref:hypothetical protein n=1 Tax=Pedobacter agri TaxID=454586 RepID=UPI00293086A0|nr:hypothetical protein [Pedobacter agri]